MLLPKRALTDHDLQQAARQLRIPHFRGVFLRDTLPSKVRNTESGIVNLDDSRGPGTHWVAYKKKGPVVHYFDSLGNLRPPNELVSYLCSGPGTRIHYNVKRYQRPNTWNCGHLCLQFLYKYPLSTSNRPSKMTLRKKRRCPRRKGTGLVRHAGQKKRACPPRGAGLRRRRRGRGPPQVSKIPDVLLPFFPLGGPMSLTDKALQKRIDTRYAQVQALQRKMRKRKRLMKNGLQVVSL